ncbi:MAG: 1,4-alpha-glucan branching enzyme, partial [Nitrospirae bacterium]
GIRRWVKDLNLFSRTEPALYETDFEPEGFQWVDFHDYENSVFSFLRFSKDKKHILLVVMNCTPVPRENYRVGVPEEGFWKECLNSDATEYGGTGSGNFGGVEAEDLPFHGRPYSLNLYLPPLGILFFKHQS